MITTLYLTDMEVADLCAPLTQPAAQARHLRELGLTVTTKPNGRPVVVRSHAEAVLSGVAQRTAAPAAASPAPAAPNVEGFLKLVGGKRHGASKKAQPA